MAQNVIIAGNQYPSVPHVTLNKTGGGTTIFMDTSDADAQDADVSQGKIYYARGEQRTGTNTGGGGTPVDMYAGRDEPTAAVGDLWVDTSDERGDWPPSVIVAGNTPVMFNAAYAEAQYGTAVSSTGISLTVPKAGTYRFVTILRNTYPVTSSTVRYYKNNSAVGSQGTVQPSSGLIYKQDISCNAGDTVTIYANSANATYIATVFGLTACISGDNGF